MLAEKYRPKDLDEIIGQTEIIERLKVNVDHLKQGEILHFLFTGPPGTGKTTAAQCMARMLFGEQWKYYYKEFNASDSRGIDDVRHTYKKLATAKGKRLIFLDEADNMTGDAQQAMRRIMETTKTTIFILSGNRYWKIIDPIRSRCVIYRFHKLSDKDTAKYVTKVIKLEGIIITADDRETLNLLVKEANGDLRRAMNILESLMTSDKHLSSKNLYAETHPIVIQDALQAALDGDAEKALSLLEDAVVNAKHDTDQLIEELYGSLRKLDCAKYDIEVIMRLHDQLSECERGCKLGGNSLIQLSGFIAFAWIAPHLRKVRS